LTKNLSAQQAVETLKAFLRPNAAAAVGIDGSMEYDERLEMILFYVCATGFRCPFALGEDLSFDLRHVERDSRLSVSAAVPLWMEDVSNVAGLTTAYETELDLERSIERIPFALMTMAELYLALNAVKDERVGIVFLDRLLSGTYGPLERDTSLLLRRGRSPFAGVQTKHGLLSLLDIQIAAYLGPGDLYVPPRGPYLAYAGIQALLTRDELKLEDLSAYLRLNDKSRDSLFKRLRQLDSRFKGLLLERCEAASIKLRSNVKRYWDRVVEASLGLVNEVFEGRIYPLFLKDDCWFTVLDLNAANLFLLHALAEEARRRHILIIGLAKDTMATDFSRAIVPYALSTGYLKLSSPLPNLRNDRAFLTILSAVNAEQLPTPWRSLAYDACFATIVENRAEAEAAPLKAARKVIAREQLFIRGYFQLRSLRDDAAMRSPLFLYDRLFYPSCDLGFHETIRAVEWGGEAFIEPFFEGEALSPMDNAALYILSKMDNPEVFEAFGHNQLLYLADKAVKVEVRAMSGLLRGVADLQLGTLARREKVFSIARRYRDLRGESESARARAAREVLRT